MLGLNSAYGMDNFRPPYAVLMERIARERSQHRSLKEVLALHCSVNNLSRNTEPSWTASTKCFTFVLQEKSRSECQREVKGSHSNRHPLATSYSRSRTTQRPTHPCVASPGQNDICWLTQPSKIRGHLMTVTRLRRGLQAAVALAVTQP